VRKSINPTPRLTTSDSSPKPQLNEELDKADQYEVFLNFKNQDEIDLTAVEETTF
jgi:hypothetical protein